MSSSNLLQLNTASTLLGKGDPFFVFIHGGPGLSHHYFFPLMQSLQNEGTMFSYDQGSFDSVTSVWTIQAIVRELRSVIETIAPNRRIILVAHSFGSVIAIEYAKQYDPNISLILLSWIYDTEWLNLFVKNNPNSNDALIKMESLNQGIDDKNIQLMNRMIAYIDYYFPQKSRSFGETLFKKLTYYPQITADIEQTWFTQVNTKLDLVSLNGNILSLTGEEDKIVFPEYFNNLKEINSNITHKVILEAGHFMCSDEVELVAKEIKSFINNFQKEIIV